MAAVPLARRYMLATSLGNEPHFILASLLFAKPLLAKFLAADAGVVASKCSRTFMVGAAYSTFRVLARDAIWRIPISPDIIARSLVFRQTAELASLL